MRAGVAFQGKHIHAHRQDRCAAPSKFMMYVLSPAVGAWRIDKEGRKYQADLLNSANPPSPSDLCSVAHGSRDRNTFGMGPVHVLQWAVPPRTHVRYMESSSSHVFLGTQSEGVVVGVVVGLVAAVDVVVGVTVDEHVDVVVDVVVCLF